MEEDREYLELANCEKEDEIVIKIEISNPQFSSVCQQRVVKDEISNMGDITNLVDYIIPLLFRDLQNFIREKDV